MVMNMLMSGIPEKWFVLNMYFTPRAADDNRQKTGRRVYSLRRACAFLEALRFRARFLRRGLWCKHASYFNLRLLSDSVWKTKISKGSREGLIWMRQISKKYISKESCVHKWQNLSGSPLLFLYLSLFLRLPHPHSLSASVSFSLQLQPWWQDFLLVAIIICVSLGGPASVPQL